MAMEENPYAAPRSVDRVVGVRSGLRGDLRKVAVAQKAILFCLLGTLLLIPAQLFVPPDLRPALAVFYVIIGLTSTVFVFILAIRVYSTALGVIFGLLAMMPCIGLITLLIVNAKATKVLQSNGYRVGMLGADLSQFTV